MKDKDIWLSPQVSVYTYIPKGYTEDQANKHRQAYAGLDNLFSTAKKIGYAKIAFGSVIITDPEALKRINEEFVLRTKWFTPMEIMRQATSISAELLALSGPRNPYPGKLGRWPSIHRGCTVSCRGTRLLMLFSLPFRQ